MGIKLTTFSSIASLSSGDWDGHFVFKDIKKTGDLGIGTFDQGNGEMIAIDNLYYQLLSDGSVHLVEDKWTSPYAMNVKFKVEKTLKLTNLTQEEYLKVLQKELALLGSQYMYALKITGTWEKIVSRTVSILKKPYPTIKEINNIQKVRTFLDVKGNMVGFYAPKYLNTISVEGIHQHFINESRESGGHVLDFVAKDLVVEIAKIDNINLLISDHDLKYDDSLQDEIKLAESSH